MNPFEKILLLVSLSLVMGILVSLALGWKLKRFKQK
jgi:hypothetical protein